MKVRQISHPIMWPASSWSRTFSCLLFGHDWIVHSNRPLSEPRCYTCGIRSSKSLPQGDAEEKP